MVKNVLLLWYQIGDNFGDVLLYRTVRDFFLDNGIKVSSYEVGEPCNEIFREANKYDMLVFCGGGIIESSVPNVIKYFIEDYEILKVPYGVVGLGVANFDYSQFRDQIDFWMKNAEFFFVRDDFSKQALIRLTGNTNCIVSADCVFHNRQLLKYGNRVGEKIGINLRNIDYKDIYGDFDSNALNQAVNLSGCNLVIPDYMDEQWRKIENKSNVELLNRFSYMERDEKIETTINEIRQCKVVIAMRYHVVLVAALMGCVPVPILYHPKVRSLTELFGIKNLAVEMDGLSDIPSKVWDAYDNYDYYRDRIKENINLLREKADNMFDEVAKIIHGGN